ncbi:MAG: HYR domain-containing protein, partial [Candidatus Wallbacteria bacterium]|nr:HYR domain-containing protein [Candidatus Wallbacteria bacterium]
MIGALVLFATLSFATVHECAAANFVPEIAASEPGGNFYWTDVAANASGRTAVFSNGRLCTSTGTGWKKNYVNPLYAYGGTVVVGSSGTTHVFYTGTFGGGGPLYHAEFSPDLPDGASSPVAEIVATAMYNSAVEDADGNLHLLYNSSGLYYRVRSGGTWSSAVRISPAGYNFGVLAMRLGSDGRTLHMTAHQTSSATGYPAGLVYGTKVPGGSWTYEPAVAVGSYLGNNVLSLAVDGQNPYIVYAVTYNLSMARRNTNGTWTAEDLVTNVGGAVQFGDADALNGTLWITYSGGSGSSDDNRPWMIKKPLPSGTLERQAIAERLGYADTPYESCHPSLTVGAGKPATVYQYNRWRLKAVRDLTNSVPTANAGADKSVVLGGLVTLTGTASDLDNDALTYSWTIQDPSGGVITQAGATVSFTAGIQGNYVATLTVVDARGAKSSDEAVVSTPVPAAPVTLTTAETPDSSAGSALDVAYDATGIPYIYSGSKLFRKEGSGWVYNTVSPAGTSNPKVIVGRSGSIHVFYSNGSTVYYTEVPAGLPNGSACPASVGVGSGGYIAAAEDAGGDLHLMYSSGGIKYKKRTAGVWGTETTISSAQPSNSTPLDLRVDPDGYTLHAAFQNVWSGGTYPGPMYAQKGPSDSTWTVEPVFEQFVSGTQLILNGSTPCLIYGTSDGYLKASTRGSNGTWKQEVLATGVAGGVQWLDADYSGGDLHVIVRHGSGSSDDMRPLYLTRSIPSGTVMASRVTANSSANTAAVAASPAGLYIAYNVGSTVRYIYNSINHAPVAEAGPNQTVECTSPSGATVTLDGRGSSDPDGSPITYAWTGPFGTATGATPWVQLPKGTNTITLVVNDGKRNSSPDTVVVTVQDTTPPVITCPPAITVVAERTDGTYGGMIGVATTTDAGDSAVMLTHDGPLFLPVGTTLVTWTATDSSGNTATCAQTVTVNVPTAFVTVTVDASTKVYGQPNPTFTATYDGFVDGDTPASLGGALVFTTVATTASPVGNYDVWSSGLMSSKYAIRYVQGGLAVAPAPLTVTANASTRPYGQPNPAFTATYTGLVAGDTPAALGGTLAFTTIATTASPLGTYDVTPSGLTASNYAITFVKGTLTITKAPLTVTTDASTRPYGQPNPTFTVTYAGFVNGETVAELTGTLAFTTAATTASPGGTYDVTPSGLTATNYAITFVKGTLTITKIPLTVTANAATRGYGQPNPTFTASYAGFVNGDTSASLGGTLSFATPATSASPVGTYDLTPSGLTATSYTFTYVKGTLTITQAALTVRADATTKVPGQPNPTFTAGFYGFANNENPAVLGGTLVFTTDATTDSPVGTYDVTPSGLTATNYAITFVKGTLTVALSTPAKKGSQLASDLQISAVGDGWYNVSAAFDGQRYLVVWAGYPTAGVRGRFVTKAGTLSGDVFTILPAAGTAHGGSRLAFNGSVYLVTGGTKGAFVTPQGAVSAPFDTGSSEPHVATDGTDFLLVWSEQVNKYDVFGQRISATGTKLGAKITISGTAAVESNPVASYGGGVYLVTWMQQPDWNLDNDVYAMRLSRAGALLDAVPIPVCTVPGWQGSWMYTGVSYDGNGKFISVFEDQRVSARAMYGSRITTNGTLLDGPASTGGLLINPSLSGCSPNGAVAGFDGTNWLVAWAGCKARGARVSPQGSVLDASGFDINKGSGAWSPALAFGDTSFLVAWYKDAGGGIMGQIVATRNNAPVAEAGSDRTIQCASASGASVTLDGRGSSDFDGDTLTYTWTGPFGTVTGATPTVQLGNGANTIALVVNDGKINSIPDIVVVTVQDTTPPVITCPPSLTVPPDQPDGTFGGSIGVATATDACDSNVAVTRNGPQFLPAGTTVVTWTARDSSGNTATCTQSVTVRAPLTITVAESTKVYGQANPTFTVTYDGFLNGDTPASLGGSLAFSTAATAASAVGAYDVTPSGLTSANYAISFVKGT